MKIIQICSMNDVLYGLSQSGEVYVAVKVKDVKDNYYMDSINAWKLFVKKGENDAQ